MEGRRWKVWSEEENSGNGEKKGTLIFHWSAKHSNWPAAAGHHGHGRKQRVLEDKVLAGDDKVEAAAQAASLVHGRRVAPTDQLQDLWGVGRVGGKEVVRLWRLSPKKKGPSFSSSFSTPTVFSYGFLTPTPPLPPPLLPLP